MAKLVLQILGESDIVVDSKRGNQMLRGTTLEDVRELAQINDEKLLDDLERVDFPLIQKIKAQQEENNKEIYFGIILTDQSQWLEAPEILQSMSQRALMDIIASDGIWWKNILDAWCQEKGINWFSIQLEIDQDIPKGVADWEGMAQLLKIKLQSLIEFKEETILVSPQTGSSVEIDQIIVQHSSGTPATSGALYLWGIEQKLEGQNVDFVYMSRQNSEPYPHSGNQWQWRFKVPQIRKLLEIQDFAGAYKLLSDRPHLQSDVDTLDRAVSFNLVNLEKVNHSAEGKVIERIAIALWSEKAFREKKHWMHWYFRVAGAFELALRCLVKKQAPEKYEWEKIHPEELKRQIREKIYPNKGKKSTNPFKKQQRQTDNPPSHLIYTGHQLCKWQFLLPMTITVRSLLIGNKTTETQYIDQRPYSIDHQINSVQDDNWKKFKEFYCDSGWHLDDHFYTSFSQIRNDLYHSLQGDKIDKYLDKKTDYFSSSTHPQHPAEIAIAHLNYIIDLADIADQVRERVAHYENKVQNVKENL